MRSTSATTKQSQTQKTPPDKGDTQQLCLPRRGVRPSGRISPRTAEITSQTKNTPVGRAKPIQPTKPSENCRTNHTNKQTHRKTLRQHSTRQHKSALCYKIQTHAAHRVKKQKPVLIRISQENLPKAREKHRKILCFT